MSSDDVARAQTALHSGKYFHAFAFFVDHLQSVEKDWNKLKFDFLISLDLVTENFVSEKKYEEVFSTYNHLMNIFPRVTEIIIRFALFLYRNLYLKEAIYFFEKALELDPNSTAALEGLETICNKFVDRWHFPMLNDRSRNEAYKICISKKVKGNKDKQILDIGSGTGILSMIAVDSGTCHVHACEFSEVMFNISKEVMVKNNMLNGINVLNIHSNDIKIPEIIPSKLDLIITETFDAGLLGEHVLSTLDHAHEKLLREPFSIIPQKARVHGCLISSKYLRRQQKHLFNKIDCLNLGKYCIVADSSLEPYQSEDLKSLRKGYEKISEPLEIITVNFEDKHSIKDLLYGKLIDLKVRCCDAGIIDAVMMWFDLHLDEESVISTSPDCSSCWEQAIFPVVFAQSDQREMLFVSRNDEVYAQFKCKEFFTLKSIKVSRKQLDEKKISSLEELAFKSNYSLGSELLKLDSSIVDLLNSETYFLRIDKFLQQVNCYSKIIFDITIFPVSSLIALKYSASLACVISSNYDDELLKLASANGIDVNKIIFFKDVDAMKDGGYNCHVLITDPVQGNGVLRHKVLEDIALIRLTCMHSDGVTFPDKIILYSCAIQCQVLVKQSKILNDDSTLGYKIGEVLNRFQTKNHLGIDLRTLKHKILSFPKILMTLNLNEKIRSDPSSSDRLPMFLKQQNEISCKIIKDGTIDAFAYWFMMETKYGEAIDQFKVNNENGHSIASSSFYEKKSSESECIHYNMFESNENCLSTLDMNSHWKQAAIMNYNKRQVQENDQIILRSTCDQSCIRIRMNET